MHLSYCAKRAGRLKASTVVLNVLPKIFLHRRMPSKRKFGVMPLRNCCLVPQFAGGYVHANVLTVQVLRLSSKSPPSLSCAGGVNCARLLNADISARNGTHLLRPSRLATLYFFPLAPRHLSDRNLRDCIGPRCCCYHIPHHVRLQNHHSSILPLTCLSLFVGGRCYCWCLRLVVCTSLAEATKMAVFPLPRQLWASRACNPPLPRVAS